MRLHRVEIKNFRSIEDATIEFEPRCRILVGMNDTGKSNVLKALASFNNQYLIQKDDLRQIKSQKIKTNSCCIKYTFSLEDSDHNNLFNSLENKVYGMPRSIFRMMSRDIISCLTEKISITAKISDATSSTTNTFSCKIENEKFLTNSRFAIFIKKEKFKKISKHDIKNRTDIKNDEKEKIEMFNKYPFIYIEKIDSLPPIHQETLSDLADNEMIETIDNTIYDLIKNKFKIIFWNSNDEKYKIHDLVPISEFVENPSKFLFLRNIFELYEKNTLNTENFDDNFISTKINDYQLDLRQNGFKTYLADVSEILTENFLKIWKNYTYNEKSVYDSSEENNHSYDRLNFKFEISFTKDRIDFNIKEKNIYSYLSSRSEGFKKFMTFLLIISTKITCENMSNTLFLIDEPETSLHHSAARDFRQELISMTEKANNYVVYGTHSISMIDQNNFNRHYVVKREQEISEILSAEKVAKDLHEENKHSKNIKVKYRLIMENEILYNRIGYSIYENLKEKNVMFEGWKDKQLFQKYLEAVKVNSEKLCFGVAHAWGAVSFKYISAVIELAERYLWIVSDSDEPAVKEKNKYTKNRGYGTWLTYQDIDSNIEAITGEDFVKNNHILKHTQNYIKQNEDDLQTDRFLTEEALQNPSLGDGKDARVQQFFYNILLENNVEDKNKTIEKRAKKIKDDIKDQIFTNLTTNDIILDEYKKLYNGILKTIKAEEKPSSSNQVGKVLKGLVQKKPAPTPPQNPSASKPILE